jgi:peptidoglycan/xylan/chitin deacetylase (PgdA/CDA1 family)
LTLKKASEQVTRDELSKTSALITKIIGQEPTLMRPPENSYSDTTKAVCLDLGLAIISWSWQSCPEDWNHRGEPDVISQFVIDKAANGHIILLHDTNSTTMEAMPAMIKGLKAKGFRFMTVSQLLAYAGDGNPKPGQVYNLLKTKPVS